MLEISWRLHEARGARILSSAVPESTAESVTTQRRTRRRLRSPAAGPGTTASAQRFLPPTVEEVGRAAALCFQDIHTDEQIAQQVWQDISHTAADSTARGVQGKQKAN